MKRIILALLALVSINANAQFTNGQILTAAALNNQFALYVPLTGGLLSGPLTVPTINVTTGNITNLTVSGTASLPAGSVTLSSLGTQAANTVLANVTSSSATPAAFVMPSCSTSSSALQYTSGTGFTCGAVANAGSNSNITSLTGLTTPLGTWAGGLGANNSTATGVVTFSSGTATISTTPNLGTPSAVVLTNGSGLPIAGLAGLGTGVATALANNATGTGGPVLNTSPTITTPIISGTVTSYNGITTAGGGVPIIVADVSFLTQTANIAQTTVYAVPAGQGGWYQVIMRNVVTSPGTTSTLPNGTIFYTDADSNGTPSANVGSQSGGNGTSTAAFGNLTVYAKAGTNIQISTSGYASTGTAMQYSSRFLVKYMGP